MELTDDEFFALADVDASWEGVELTRREGGDAIALQVVNVVRRVGICLYERDGGFACSYSQCAIHIGEYVVVCLASTDNDVVNSIRTFLCCLAGDNWLMGKHIVSTLSVAESTVRYLELWVGLSHSAGIGACRDSNSGRIDGELGVLVDNSCGFDAAAVDAQFIDSDWCAEFGWVVHLDFACYGCARQFEWHVEGVAIVATGVGKGDDRLSCIGCHVGVFAPELVCLEGWDGCFLHEDGGTGSEVGARGVDLLWVVGQDGYIVEVRSAGECRLANAADVGRDIEGSERLATVEGIFRNGGESGEVLQLVEAVHLLALEVDTDVGDLCCFCLGEFTVGILIPKVGAEGLDGGVLELDIAQFFVDGMDGCLDFIACAIEIVIDGLFLADFYRGFVGGLEEAFELVAECIEGLGCLNVGELDECPLTGVRVVGDWDVPVCAVGVVFHLGRMSWEDTEVFALYIKIVVGWRLDGVEDGALDWFDIPVCLGAEGAIDEASPDAFTHLGVGVGAEGVLASRNEGVFAIGKTRLLHLIGESVLGSDSLRAPCFSLIHVAARADIVEIDAGVWLKCREHWLGGRV